MKIEVLGVGCKRCEQLYENAVAAASVNEALNIQVEKVADVNYFARMGVFMTPGLVIEGEVVSTGKLLSANQIQQKIEEKL